MALDERLYDFGKLRQDVRLNGLLVGNGASRAVWEGFSYPSLYDLACTKVENPLAKQDQDLFCQLGNTRNFELVLSALASSGTVNAVFGDSRAKQDASYARVRTALVEAVKTTHVPWQTLNAAAPKALEVIGTEFGSYKFVFSTNYDLLAYWAVVSEPRLFKDYFWSADRIFNAANTSVRGAQTLMLYLHGGLHLYRTVQGETLKRSPVDGANLLDLFGTPIGEAPGAVPLFVSEGTSADKKRSIFRSDYLMFAYLTLNQHEGPMCVFGQSLNESDRHIVEAIVRSGATELAISILPGSKDDIIKAKAHYTGLFPGRTLLFYDAATHPLGCNAVRVP